MIPGFPGYEASDQGQIRAIRSRVRCKQGVPLSPWVVVRHGRMASYVQLGRGNKMLVHRLVCLAFHGEPPEGKPDCMHIDHNSLNNAASNLRWGSHADNIQANYDRELEARIKAEDSIGLEPYYEGPNRNSEVPF